MEVKHCINTDACLVHEYVSGNEKALEILITLHQSRIFGFIYSKIRNRDVANDIFQDTTIKAINVLKSTSYNEEDKFLPWVMRIANNLIMDHFRKIKRIPLCKETEDFSVFSVLPDNSSTIENQLIASQIEIDLRRIIQELPEDQKEIVMMRMYQDLSYKEISEITGISINTALGRMRYALLNLRKVIDKHQIILTN